MTLFISEKNNKKTLRSFFIYLGITAFIALFGSVYQLFGHGQHSLEMYLAFLFPLVLGCCTYLASRFLPVKWVPSFLAQNFYNTGVGILTCGFIFKGVVEIYGTSRPIMFNTYIIIGCVLIGIGLALYIIGLISNKFSTNKKEEITN